MRRTKSTRSHVVAEILSVFDTTGGVVARGERTRARLPAETDERAWKAFGQGLQGKHHGPFTPHTRVISLRSFAVFAEAIIITLRGQSGKPLGRNRDPVCLGCEPLWQKAGDGGVQGGVHPTFVSELVRRRLQMLHLEHTRLPYLLSLFLRFFATNGGWTLPALFSILRDLRDLAFDVSSTCDAKTAHTYRVIG